MKRFIVRRIFLGVIVLFGVILITFTATRLIPANPALKWAGPRATPEQVAAAAAELNLDKPIYEQLVYYIRDLLHGDLGYSYVTKSSVTEQLLLAIPNTLELVIFACVFAIALGIIFGVMSARYQNKIVDHLIRFFSIGAVSLPSFWMALALQLIFYGILGWLPIGGRVSTEIMILYQLPDITGFFTLDCLLAGEWNIFKDALIHMILPTIPLTFYPTGIVARMTRSALLEIMNEDYITAEKSYGISERFIIWNYGLKNSIAPTTTVATLAIGYTLINTFLVESIYAWPGIGRYVYNAIESLDYPAIMGVTIFSAIVYLILNLVADIIIALDPRIRI